MARGGSPTNLCCTLEMLLADGLKIKHPWDMIVTVTAPGIHLIKFAEVSSVYFEMSILNFKKKKKVFARLTFRNISGPATNNVYSLVNELDKSEKSLNSRVEAFFNELIK